MRIAGNPKPYAIVGITKHGSELARKLASAMPDADLYLSEKFLQKGDEASVYSFPTNVRLLLETMFHRYEGWILVVSLGAVVRMTAPLLKDKKVDPAVVVVDDKAKFAISVLSGHLGGANALTERVAEILGATPVVTTASDVSATIAVDLLGREFGWKIDDDRQVTPASAAVVNEEPVAVIQETGEPNWWKRQTPIPKQIGVFPGLEEARSARPEGFNAVLWVTDRLLTEDELSIAPYRVVYRPKSLVVGLGCNRGTSFEEIENVVLTTLDRLGLSWKSVSCIATITLKQDEEGLLALSEKYGWPLLAYTPEQLNSVSIPNPSETVFKFTGAYGVSEPAALLAACTDHLLLEKTASGNVTISVARIEFGGGKADHITGKAGEVWA
ncbi:cobalt-precorrin 5A hydrolase [Effusibacillus lacus]|uniref:Cobalamin biosynthesis protein CbiG n=1 Tax=Effusibacillus lacus TaxID=1348429 RepID=A0A292YQJ7_9BACL|nr:cobalamin biosynthesis protein [Effusibacillus lacus]TCS75704.1 cobalt-precorrin 5A acetaldehyde-lyase [Effusibacillus lacus]GAX91023.1 cobalamin biosynthesis protein CbiG [Effusibacillus lacus]